ncbi:MAG: carnitine 3-dehydrogenase [Paracoccaceae bacterium]
MGVAAIIGGGVIGGGWAARFLLNGWDARVFDPDPEAERKIGEVLHNARRSLPGLNDAALPMEGNLSFHTSMSDAVRDVDWIQESVPERIDIKYKVFAELQKACALDAIIGSSTSGFKPSELQEGALRPGQIVVAHPFNPVYLLPLIELVPTDANEPEFLARAKTTLTGLGLYPLLVRKEIDAHIADRFLEAVWREALWLVKDGIATTEEIDNAIRYGFGIRWAQMGLFETYRVAGGEAGMKHFMAQFGPCLKSPWTKLMDVPEFTDELVDMIAYQSDAQSGSHSIRELERIRDNNLVAMLRALKGQGYGAGALLNAHDAALTEKGPVPATLAQVSNYSVPLVTLAQAVPLDWLDYNGHMNEARYLEAFSRATDHFMMLIGCDADYIANGGSFFTAETHIRHLDEAPPGAPIRVSTRVIEGAGKKMHLWHEMTHAGSLLATGEQMLLHVSLATRRPAAMPDEMQEILARFADGQAELPEPEGKGRAIGARR